MMKPPKLAKMKNPVTQLGNITRSIKSAAPKLHTPSMLNSAMDKAQSGYKGK